MHIPDGFLDTKTIVATTALSVIGIGTAWREMKARMPARRVPVLGLAAAFVFAAQMLNFPVAAGTSGHLMGAVLVSVLFGPSAAVIVITSVLVVQCFLFADGGLLALGANVFNMAVIGSIVGYSAYHLVNRGFRGRRGHLVAVAFASWCSVVVASICVAGELAWSGIVPWRAGFPAMASVHMLIGLGEGLITCLVIAAISKARPDLLATTAGPTQPRAYGNIIVYGAIITFGLLLFVSPFASSWPDGLEMVAAKLGFDQKALQNRAATSLIPDYKFPGVGPAAVATIVGGAIGVVVVFVLALFLARMLKAKQRP